jgi:hypothetical protein
MVKAHCTNSTSKMFGDDEWVSVRVEVLGLERVRHFVGDEMVLQYERPMIGGGVATTASVATTLGVDRSDAVSSRPRAGTRPAP